MADIISKHETSLELKIELKSLTGLAVGEG